MLTANQTTRPSTSPVYQLGRKITDAQPERKKPIGFCESSKCARSLEPYFIKTRRWYYVTTNKKIFSCPKCGHALFWSCFWHMGDHE